MSHIGKKEIQIPKNVEVVFLNNSLNIKGPLGEKKLNIPPFLRLEIQKDIIYISLQDESQKKFWGTFRSVVHNTILGLNQGFQVTLKIVGVGYRVSLEKNALVLRVGFSHDVTLEIPKEIQVKCVKSFIILQSHDKELVTQYAAYVKSQKMPEPYKGKGILYKKEKIRRKEGKKK
jgi:large subunit ribosomal protein L6